MQYRRNIQIRSLLIGLLLIFLSGCGVSLPDKVIETNQLPNVFPEMVSVAVPFNIAPMNFGVEGNFTRILVEVISEKGSFIQKFKGNKVRLDEKKWHKLLAKSKSDSLYFQVYAYSSGTWHKYLPFGIYVAPDPIDQYLVYRLIRPGFQTWSQMGIYQRNLQTFAQKTIVNSKMMPATCMNCHSFESNKPENMLLHLRENNAGTILRQGDTMKKINTLLGEGSVSVAFSSWHPSGKYIAFSVNKVRQLFHAKGQVRAHALDMHSDIVIYNVGKDALSIPELLHSELSFEAFPCFSPDGNSLYYATAPAGNLPRDQELMKYSICAVSFDVETGQVGNQADTLVSAVLTGKSATMPRVSPDGKYLMYTRLDYGNFPAYNTEADLYLHEFATGRNYPVGAFNSDDVDSHHAWSSNGRWVVFSSRRMDGLVMNSFIGYFDQEGRAHKPFVMPQKDAAFYNEFLFSFNLPEFVVDEVELDRFDFERVARTPLKAAPGSGHSSH